MSSLSACPSIEYVELPFSIVTTKPISLHYKSVYVCQCQIHESTIYKYVLFIFVMNMFYGYESRYYRREKYINKLKYCQLQQWNCGRELRGWARMTYFTFDRRLQLCTTNISELWEFLWTVFNQYYYYHRPYRGVSGSCKYLIVHLCCELLKLLI